jgi:predicted TIM-barrel fold metal-dependent hydrolase
MRDNKISISILSITSPGTHLTPSNDEHAVEMTRQTNEELATICAAHPKEFRFFASLPLPCVKESVEEIGYALDTLGAVGFTVMSNSNSVYLGDPSLDPVFAELDRRRATVFIHPTSCNVLHHGCGDGMIPIQPLHPIPGPMVEFAFDETRTVASLLLNNTLVKYRNVTIIMSHCGGTLPPMIDRIGIFGQFLGAPSNQSDAFKKILRERFFFDMAGFPFPEQIHGLLRLLGGERAAAKRILYGSDFPYTPATMVGGLCNDMDREFKKLFHFWQRKDIQSGNAKKLFGLSGRKFKQWLDEEEDEKMSPSAAGRTLKGFLCL